jgi:hypothetical protein
MTARTSRLDALLRVRRIEEETGRGRLAAAAHAERAAHALLEQASREYDLAVDGASAHGSNAPEVAPTALPDFLGTRRRHEALAGTVRVAGAGVTQARSAADLARTAWSAAAMRLAALERLHERGREADRLARLATDQRTAEESASGRTMTLGRTA